MPCLCLLLFAMLFAAGPAVAEPALERLFSTPAERAALDRQRHQRGAGDSDDVPLVRADHVTLDGYARHSNGKATAWINQGAEDAPLPLELIGASARPRGPARVSMQREGQRIDLKVGQTYDVGSHTIREQYQEAPRDVAAPRVTK